MLHYKLLGEGRRARVFAIQNKQNMFLLFILFAYNYLIFGIYQLQLHTNICWTIWAKNQKGMKLKLVLKDVLFSITKKTKAAATPQPKAVPVDGICHSLESCSDVNK